MKKRLIPKGLRYLITADFAPDMSDTQLSSSTRVSRSDLPSRVYSPYNEPEAKVEGNKLIIDKPSAATVSYRKQVANRGKTGKQKLLEYTNNAIAQDLLQLEKDPVYKFARTAGDMIYDARHVAPAVLMNIKNPFLFGVGAGLEGMNLAYDAYHNDTPGMYRSVFEPAEFAVLDAAVNPATYQFLGNAAKRAGNYVYNRVIDPVTLFVNNRVVKPATLWVSSVPSKVNSLAARITYPTEALLENLNETTARLIPINTRLSTETPSVMAPVQLRFREGLLYPATHSITREGLPLPATHSITREVSITGEVLPLPATHFETSQSRPVEVQPRLHFETSQSRPVEVQPQPVETPVASTEKPTLALMRLYVQDELSKAGTSLDPSIDNIATIEDLYDAINEFNKSYSLRSAAMINYLTGNRWYTTSLMNKLKEAVLAGNLDAIDLYRNSTYYYDLGEITGNQLKSELYRRQHSMWTPTDELDLKRKLINGLGHFVEFNNPQLNKEALQIAQILKDTPGSYIYENSLSTNSTPIYYNHLIRNLRNNSIKGLDLISTKNLNDYGHPYYLHSRPNGTVKINKHRSNTMASNLDIVDRILNPQIDEINRLWSGKNFPHAKIDENGKIVIPYLRAHFKRGGKLIKRKKKD